MSLRFAMSGDVWSRFRRARLVWSAALLMAIAVASLAWVNLASGQSVPPVTGPIPNVLMANGHLPAVRDTTADLVSITAAQAQYGGAIASDDDPTDPRVTALAANLGNDIDRIYDFVRNSVEYYPNFGLGKGAVGALLDRDGDAFDQAHLFVELARASGVPARYVLGTISLTPAQAAAWLGPNDARALCRLLAGAGIPASVNGQSGACATVVAAGPITSVSLLHLWAEAQIGGVWYTFDPAFKAYEIIADRPTVQSTTLASIMGMSPGAPWATLSSGATLSATAFGNFNQAGLDSALSNWSQNVLNWQTQASTPASVQEIVGGRRLLIDANAVRQTSHPLKAAGSATTTWTGDIPNQYRTKLTIAGGGLTWSAYADALAGHRVTIDSVGVYPVMGNVGEQANLGNPPIPEYYLDWWPVIRTDQCLETASSPGDLGFDDSADAPCAPVASGNQITQFMTITVDAPLAANNGQYLDEQFTKGVSKPVQIFDDIRTPGVTDPYIMHPIAADVIFLQGRATEAGLLAYRSAYTQTGLRERTQYSDDCIRDQNGDPIPQYMPCGKSFRESYSGVGTFVRTASFWLNQESARRSPSDFAGRLYGAVEGEVARLVEAISGARLVHHYSVGVIVTGSSVDMESRWSSVDGASSGSGRRAFRTLAGFVPAFEAAALREAGAMVDGSGITAKSVWTGDAVLRRGSGPGSQLVRLTPGDSAAALLPGYSAGGRAFVQNYLDAGFTIAAPAAPQALGIGAGVGFHVVHEGRGDIATITIEDAGGLGGWARALKGAAAALASAPAGANGLTSYSDTLGERDAKARAHLGGVDLRTGALSFSEPTEVSMGQGDFPYALSFQRTFNSEGFADDGGLGQGWTHNFASHLEPSTSIFNALGDRNPRAAAATIAALRAAYEVAGSGAIEQSVAIGAISDWWFNTSLFNTVSVSVGAESEQFVRIADNSWMPLGASNSTLSFANLPSSGVEALYAPVANANVVVSRRLKDGSVQRFGAVGQSYNNTPFKWALKSWEFPQGITATLSYRGSGNLSSVSTPLASLSFDMSNDAPKTKYECSFEGMSVCGTSGQELVCTQRRVLCATLEGSSKKLNAVSNGTTTAAFTYQDITSAGAIAPDQSVVKTVAIPGVVYARTYDYELHDTRTRLTDTHSAAGHKANFGYTPFGPYVESRVRTADDALNRRYRYQTVGVGAAHVIDPLAYSINPNANHRIARYDMDGRLVANTDELGRTYTTAYDAYGRVTSRRSAYGDSYYYFYDARHNMVRAEHRPKDPPPGGWGTVSQTGNWWAQTVIARAEYGDANWPDRPTKVWAPATADDPNPAPTEFFYHAARGLLERAKAPPTFNGVNGQTQAGEVTFEYDGYGRPIRSTDPTGRVVEQAFGGVVSGATQPAHCLTSTTVDPDRFMYTGLKLKTQQECDAVGNVTAVIDPRGNRSTTQYDKLRRATQTEGPLGTNIATRWTFDADGNTIREERRLGVSTWLATDTTYSATGTPLTVTDPDGDRSRTCYDLLDRPYMAVDPDGRVTRTTYNAADQPLLIERWLTASPNDAACTVGYPNPAPTSPALYADYKYGATYQHRRMNYTPEGLLDAEIDANGNRTTFIYEGLGRVIQTNFSDPDRNGSRPQPFELTLRNERGEVVHRRQRNDRWVRYFFDAAGRPTTVYQQGQGGEYVQARAFSFDLAGRPTMRVVYDCASANCATVNARDMRTFRIDPAGRTDEEYAYADYAANPSQFHQLRYGFDAASNRTALRWPDAFEAQYSFDVANRLVQAKAGAPSSATLGAPLASTVVQADYGYDTLSRRKSVTRANGAHSTYDYDNDNDLQQVAHATVGGTQPSFSFAYLTNASGQIASMTVSHAAFQWAPAAGTSYGRVYGGPDGLNQQASEGGRAIVWDEPTGLNSGNMVSASFDGSALSTALTHDAMNRLTTASNASMAASYLYDADDRRVAKAVTSGGTTTITRTLWSGTDELAEYDGAGAVQRRIVPGPGIDDKVAMVEVTANNAVRYFHTDRLGSVVALTSATGAVTDSYAYSAFGESAAATGNPWRYTGRYLDAETGLYYYRARYYSPRLGQFLETDPIGTKDDPNLYMYVGNDPGNLTDPSGLLPKSEAEEQAFFQAGRENAEAIVNHPGETLDLVGQLLQLLPWPQSKLAGRGLSGAGRAITSLQRRQQNSSNAESAQTSSAGTPSAVQGRFYRGRMRRELLDKTRDASGTMRCTYCDKAMTNTPGRPDSAQVDHIDPASRGGPTTPENGAGACANCNVDKGSKKLGSEWIPPKDRR